MAVFASEQVASACLMKADLESAADPLGPLAPLAPLAPVTGAELLPPQPDAIKIAATATPAERYRCLPHTLSGSR